MLEIKFVDQVLYKSFLESKVQRHGWITIDLCNVEDEQKKIQPQIKVIAARCEETPLAGWGGVSKCRKIMKVLRVGFEMVETVDFFVYKMARWKLWDLLKLPPWWPLALPWNLGGILAVAGGENQWWRHFLGVSWWCFFVYWEYWISILTMRSMSSLWKNRIDMIYWIGIQCLNVIFGGVGGAAFLVYVLFICFFRDSTCNPLAK